jgi:uncharacterized membrane protein YdjX (TVP38/TMEM64 family)
MPKRRHAGAAAAKRRGPAWGQIGLIVLGTAALAAAWRFTPLAEFLTPSEVREWSQAARRTPWAPLVLVFAYIPAAIVMFPRPLLTLVAVVAFGPWLGFGYSTVGIVAAALATYAVGRFMRYETIRKTVGDRLDAVKKVLDRHGILSVFAVNMSPTPPFVLQGIIAGAIRVRLFDYIAGTVLSVIPGMIAWSIFGTQINAALSDPEEVSYWLIGGAVVLLVAVAFATRRWITKKDP